jgi:RNA polymerase sigma-70 factor, ECF subfamily
VNELTDEKIVKQVQGGDIDMFGILIERYEAKIQRYARKFLSNNEDIKDLIQDVFTKAYINIDSFELNRSFSPWLYRIAHNRFINELKKNKAEPVFVFDIDVFFPHFFSDITPETEAIKSEVIKKIGGCINKIDLKYKEIIILYYFEDMSYKEISDILHVPIAAVGMRLNRAKKVIKKLMIE